MVLQDLGDTPADDLTGNGDPSDSNDTFSYPSRLDTSSFVRPLPLPFLGFSEQAVRRRSEATIKYAERRINRAMTYEEQQVLASHLYKMEETKSYFALLGVGAGGLRAYRTMDTCRYPFYQPKAEDIKPDKFMFVKGPGAYFARHSWRFALYFLVASQVGKLIGQAVAQPLAARATANEPQLAQFGRDLKAGIEGDHRKAREYSNQSEEERQAARERFEREPQSPSPSGAAASTSEMTDDMSPTSGEDPWSSSSSPTWGDLGLSSESQSNAPPPPQGQAAPSRRGQYDSAPRSQEDDMSPTGGMFQDEVQRQPASGESAWERLRRRGAPSPSQRTPRTKLEPPQREQREGSTLGDSFTFAESDADRKRAQQKAQREFDARLEQERQGKDFNEERRW
ncbi:hypothetical protein BDV96DRAFT_485177 [Lophiotrema nucula]|uniref:Uncharacterized protein n=1 Tax=Lophiotrema nucula TaxID=690887 RepID=A0A6A5ZNJ2_9PLEO|nr:hypothetical protein BDV96DRAFT_485177 [Lophiotrema nucula]